MIARFCLTLLLLTLPFHARGQDAPKPDEFPAKVTAAKDVPAVAALLQEQLNRPMICMLEINDVETLGKAKAGLADALTNINAITKRLKELPVPSNDEREAQSKKTLAANETFINEKKPLMKAHMQAMPEALRAASLKELSAFYKELDVHKEVFAAYLQPDSLKPKLASPAPVEPAEAPKKAADPAVKPKTDPAKKPAAPAKKPAPAKTKPKAE